MSLSRLVLFDIDGTLLHAGRSWRNCFEESLRLEFPTAEFPQISFGGKTDPQICRELLCNLIDDTDLLDQIVNRVLMNYVERLETNITTIRNDLILLPGVRAALEHLSDVKGVELGVLTGNLRVGADLKLQGANLHRYFKMGVYADDHSDRYKLPELAVKRAKALLNLDVKGREVVIIGDTVHDILCGKSIFARSIAVGTGRGSNREDLLNSSPDFFLADLSNTSNLLKAILSD